METIPDIEQGPITVDALHEMMEAAINIPSVAMELPVQFIVLNDIETLSKVSDIITAHPFAKQALSAITVCGDLGKAQLKDKLMLDCEAAAQQILLTAHANGIGAYISPIYPDNASVEGITELLDLPENIVAHSYVSLSYPAKVPDTREVPGNERVHYNSWVRKKSII
ncbi:MAG: hypothetical protein ABFR35_06260 [Thermodesulfobacteriota bacterium]